MADLKYSDVEPVRIIGWANSVVIAAASIINQLQTSFDSHSGWFGLALAALVAIGTEVQRSKVTPMAKLDEATRPGIDGTTVTGQ